ncbi:MAG TPA: TatD family hydrolase [Polyangiaceae bacterium]|nr:TatD family hydrolase [Polyangiaceae bacterium]
MLIDTHCHLDPHYFPEGADETLIRARRAGVTGFVCIGVGSLEQIQSAIALAERRSDVWATVGVHPHDAASHDGALDQALVALSAKPRIVAIGEIGLDFHYDHSPREKQQEVFRRFIALARQLKKPIVIHTRSAPAETLQVLTEEGASDVGGIIHCFSENKAFAQQALDLNFDISFSGIVTFKKATDIQEVAAWAPADRILVETDSPYLAPVPLRGKRCEPAHVLHTARFVADLRGIGLEEVAQITSENARRRLGVSAVLN